MQINYLCAMKLPTMDEFVNFFADRPHISVKAIEKEIGCYSGQLSKALTGTLKPLKPVIRIKLAQALKPYGFTPSKREPRSAGTETEKKEVQPEQVTTQGPQPQKRIFLRK